MFFRIFKNDFKRKKTVNIVLFLFIILSTVFVSSGINTVLSVMNGTEYYLDKAQIGDYAVATDGKEYEGKIEEIVKDMDCVSGYRIEPILYGSKDNIRKSDGTICECKNTTIFQSMEQSGIKFFDANNEEFTKVEPGHIATTGNFMANNNLKPGDKVFVKIGDTEREFIIDCKVKDAFMGSAMMGNTRFIMNEVDYNEYRNDEKIARGELAYIDTTDVTEVASALSKIQGIIFDAPKSTMKLLYVMETIVAILVLILSICLIIVAFVALKFSINLTIAEEYREIGVMKAIGLKNFSIRQLYIIKYFFMATIGGMVGLALSFPLGKILLKSAADNMVLGNDAGCIPNVIGAVFVVFVITAYVYFCTRKIKKASPIDAIREGQSGERYKQKNVYKASKSHLPTNLYMAINDVLSSPKKYLTVFISICICTVLMLVIVNTTATMRSDKLIDSLGPRADLYVTDVSAAMELMDNKTEDDIVEYLHKMEKELEDNGMPARVTIDVSYKCTMTVNGNEYLITSTKGIGRAINEYGYNDDVIVPENKNEILITSTISKLTGAKVGDTVTIDFGEEQLNCLVTGTIENMNQVGKIIRIHQDTPTGAYKICNTSQFQITFKDSPSVQEIENRKERIKKLYNNDEVMNMSEYCADCVSVTDTLETVQNLLLGITLIVVLLVTILICRSFVADEKSQIAVLKAIGFKDRDIIRQYMCRFGFVGLLSVICAALLSIPLTKLCITPVFAMMGNHHVDYYIDVFKVFFAYPGIVFLMTVIVAFFAGMYSKKVTPRDTANNE